MQKKERMANLEVLRCVAMMMVVVLHYLGKGGLLPDLTAPLSAQDTVAWLLGSILHRGGQCLHDDQRLLFMRKLL